MKKSFALAAGLAAMTVGSSAWALGVSEAHPELTGVCGTPQPREKCERRIGQSGPQPRRKIYLNRAGGTFTPGASTDATLDRASIAQQTGTLAPLEMNDTNWATLVACVADYYEEWNVDVVEVEPSADEFYVEVVVAGNDGTELGFGSPGGGGILLGIASADNFCDVTEHGICFTFAGAHLTAYGGVSLDLGATARKQLCDTAAHEAGHLLGLEHEVKKEDLMSYETLAAGKGFVDFDSQCGTYESAPGPCSCGSSGMQNSNIKLDDLLGPNDLEAPTVSITTPGAGGTVGPGFSVAATATDNFSVEKLELVIDGVVVDSDVFEPFELEAPADTTLGAHELSVVAWDKSSNTGTATIQITVEPGCTGPADCGEDELCVNNACLGDVGAPCDQTGDCAGAICAAGDGSKKFCTKTCIEGDDGACPSGYVCEVQGGGSAKCFTGGGGGGCMSAGGRRGAAGGGAAATFVLFGLLALRARRRRA